MMNNRVVRWGVYILVAALFAVLCVYLSRWQFDRNQSRSEEIALVEQNYNADPVALDDVIGADGDFAADDEWQPVLLHGEYLSDDQLLARNRPHGGTSAFEVLVPFRTDDGRVFIIDRGWVPPADGESAEAVPDAPQGEVEVVVRVRPGEAQPRSGRGAPEGQVPTIHLPTIADLIGGDDVITSAYGELVSEDPSTGESLGAFDAPTEDPGPHLSYAIQWILFAIMGFTFIGYIIRTEIIKSREEAEDGPTPREKKRRRDRDADIEDGLLDSEEQHSLSV